MEVGTEMMGEDRDGEEGTDLLDGFDVKDSTEKM